MLAHGTITFDLNCTVAFTSAIAVGAGTTDIEGNGFNVEFTGGGTTRFFTHLGGTLTLGGLALEGGFVAGATGANGTGGGGSQSARRMRVSGVAMVVRRVRGRRQSLERVPRAGLWTWSLAL